VSFRNDCGLWRSEITHQGKRYVPGAFRTEEEAARAYDNKARELLGEKAILNFARDGEKQYIVKSTNKPPVSRPA